MGEMFPMMPLQFCEEEGIKPAFMVPIKLAVSTGNTENLYVSINACLYTPISFIKMNVLPYGSVLGGVDGNLFQGINGSRLEILGLFDTSIRVENEQIPFTFHVVPNNTMNYLSLLGRDFIQSENFEISLGQELQIREKEKSNDISNEIQS